MLYVRCLLLCFTLMISATLPGAEAGNNHHKHFELRTQSSKSSQTGKHSALTQTGKSSVPAHPRTETVRYKSTVSRTGVQPALAFHSNARARLQVRVTGLPSHKGSIAYGLFNSKEDFSIPGREFVEGFHPIQGDDCVFTIDDLPYGEYALAIYHDENDNQDIDYSEILFVKLPIPKEAVGVSNYEEKMFSQPDYDKAKFTVTDATSEIQVRLFKY